MTHHLLVAHGSPDPRHAAVLRSVVAALPAYGVSAELAFLEFDQPRAEAAVAVRRDGPVLVVGLLLAPGYHAREDIPRLVGAALGDVLDGGVLGAGRWLFGVLDELVASVGGDTGTGVVLVTAGSSRPDARAHLSAFGRAWSESRPGSVRVVSDSQLGHAPEGGTDVVVPLLLAPGVLADRVADLAGAAGLRCTSVLGLADGFAAALAGRLGGSAAAAVGQCARHSA